MSYYNKEDEYENRRREEANYAYRQGYRSSDGGHRWDDPDNVTRTGFTIDQYGRRQYDM